MGQISTTIKLLTSRDEDLTSYSDKINETEPELRNTPLKHMFINNHDIAAKTEKNYY